MSEASPPFLVVGGTGRHGGTGAFVARQLLKLGMPVRTLVRQKDARAIALEAVGAKVVVGDLRDRRSLIPALEGVVTAYFTYPIAGGIVDAAANFASAARAAGLKRVVVMSMAPAHPDSPSHLGRAQWLAEELLEWSGVSCIDLRIAALFFENLELLHREDILRDGVIRNSFPDLPMNWISGQDAGKLAIAALRFPERFGDKREVYPTGTEKFTHTEVAGIIGRHLGRSLRHETISAEAWQTRLMELSQQDERISLDMPRHISAVGASMRKPFPINDMFLTVTREQPMTLDDALRTGYLSFKTRALSGSRER
ncbi:MAG: NmrA family NAD(P)-binding protein [Candidatus Acidiferrales bacterium]